MKVSKEKAAENRQAIVDAAGKLFRAHGFDGVGVAEITKAAGLTHGGFYGHFASKDALAAEACGQVFDGSLSRLPDDIEAFIERYLGETHRDAAAPTCPMAAFTNEMARQPEAVQARFADGVGRYVEALAARLPGGRKDERRRRAATLLASLVGGLSLARATAKADPDLSQQILGSVRTELGRALKARKS